MKKLKRNKRQKYDNLYDNEYCYDNFKVYSPESFTTVQWGEPGHIKQKKCYMKNSDLIIQNRFDFGKDDQILIRSTKNPTGALPNIFNLKKKQSND